MDKKSTPLIQALKSTGDTEIPAMRLVRLDPGAAAVISKLLTGRTEQGYDNSGKLRPDLRNSNDLKLLSDRTSQNIVDAKTVLQTLPDLEMASQILVSSVLCPKDMMTMELTYLSPTDLLPPEVASAMVARIKLYFEQTYKIKPLLPKILRDSLIETGSYPVVVLPENAIDDVINQGGGIQLESLESDFAKDGSIKPIGLLGPSSRCMPTEIRTQCGLSAESLDLVRKPIVESLTNIDSRVSLEKNFNNAKQDTGLFVTDNYNLLKVPMINQKVRERRVLDTIGSPAFESIYQTNAGEYTDQKLMGKIYRRPKSAFNPIVSVKSQDQLSRRTVGEPLVQHQPSESVIPVYVPGNVETHIGYFVLLDEEGNAIQSSKSTDYYSQLQSRMNSNGSFASAMLQKVDNNMNGFTWSSPETFTRASQLYGSMVERELMERLRNGVYGKGVKIAGTEEIYRLMLARSLSQQQTQMLFIPAELMTYFAFKYTENGVGKSMLDDLKIINSLRSMLLFANVMAGVKNSIGRTEVRVKLDEEDPDPAKTIERTIHEIARTRQQSFPIGNNSPTDLADWITRAGMEFTFEGHPGLPDVNVDFGEKASSYSKPDTELAEDMRKQSLMGLGIPPEIIDNAYSPDFATSILSNNLLLSKRVIQLQDQFTPQLSVHMRQVAMHSQNLVDDLRGILKENVDTIIRKMTAKAKRESVSAKRGNDGQQGTVTVVDPKTGEPISYTKNNADFVVNDLLYKFITGFNVELPQPNSVSLSNQMEAFNKQSEALDSMIETYINTEMLNDTTMGDLANGVETLKSVIKNYFLRKWASENGVMTELADLVTMDEEGKPSMNLYELSVKHLELMTKSMAQFMKDIDPTKLAANIFAQEGLEANGPDSSSGSDTSTTDSSSDNSSSDSSDSSEKDGDDDVFSMDDGGDSAGAGFGDAMAALDEMGTDGGAAANAEAEKKEG